MLSAVLILAVMVIPFTSSVAREVLRAVPMAQREAAYALGATQWEAIRAALYYGRTGIVGAIMLGFGRALGETMAVTMVIGNNPQISLSLFAPQYTMAAVLANEFTEAADELYLDALIEVGLVLFVITLFVNAGSRILIWRMNRTATVRTAPPVVAAPVGRHRMKNDAVRRLISKVITSLCAFAVLVALVPLALILFLVITQGILSLNLDFFSQHAGTGWRTGRRHGERDRRHADPDWARGGVRDSHRRHQRHLRGGVLWNEDGDGGAVCR